MRSDAVVIVGIGFQNPAQMRLAQDNDVVHTLTPDRSDQPAGAPSPTTFAPSRLRSAARIAACRSIACFRVALGPCRLPARRQSPVPSSECQPAAARLRRFYTASQA